jgi:WD repeat-containing protein 55
MTTKCVIKKFKYTVNDVCLPREGSIFYAADIDGTLHRRSIGDKKISDQYALHEESIRCLALTRDERGVITGSSDRQIACFDGVKNTVSWSMKDAHKDCVNCIFRVEGTLASADDSGTLKLWDLRTHKSTFENVNMCKDYVSAMTIIETKPEELLIASGDGTLTAFDLRTRKILVRSDDQEDELLSLEVIKNGKKVIAGTQEGPILVFSSGSWRDQSDRFPGHPHSVSALAKVDESTVLTGSSDGIIRLVSVQPNRLLGAIGDHDDYPIERLCVSYDKCTLASCSHDNTVKLWDIGYFWDEDEAEEEKEDETSNNKKRERVSSTKFESNKKRKAPKKFTKKTGKNSDFFDDL